VRQPHDIFVAATDDHDNRIWLRNPEYRSGGVILRFTAEHPSVVLPIMEGRLIRMHRANVEHFLDENFIPWAADYENTPFMALFLNEEAGVHVVWPFRLIGPLPRKLTEKCSFEEVCTVPGGADFVLYGG
jgi:hypothetical protein